MNFTNRSETVGIVAEDSESVGLCDGAELKRLLGDHASFGV